MFEFLDFRLYLRAYLKRLPKHGRGELSRIARHLRINTTLLSQIMAGSRHFTAEQAHDLSLYLGHTELEVEYFALLVQLEKASTEIFKKHIQKKMQTLREEALRLSKRVPHERRLLDNERAVFYSSWIYSAVHLYASTNSAGVSMEEVAVRFDLSKQKAAEILLFLNQIGLCIKEVGRYKMGVQSTFLEQGSPHLLKHHANWRIQAIRKSESLLDTELMFTGQMSLAKKDVIALRAQIVEFLKSTAEIVKDSPAEEIVCLNIDFLKV